MAGTPKRIVHGNTVYPSMAECMDTLEISYNVMKGLLRDAAKGKPAMIYGLRIYELANSLHHVERPARITDTIERRAGAPLLPVLCRHRLGVYHGGQY